MNRGEHLEYICIYGVQKDLVRTIDRILDVAKPTNISETAHLQDGALDESIRCRNTEARKAITNLNYSLK